MYNGRSYGYGYKTPTHILLSGRVRCMSCPYSCPSEWIKRETAKKTEQTSPCFFRWCGRVCTAGHRLWILQSCVCVSCECGSRFTRYTWSHLNFVQCISHVIVRTPDYSSNVTTFIDDKKNSSVFGPANSRTFTTKQFDDAGQWPSTIEHEYVV